MAIYFKKLAINQFYYALLVLIFIIISI